MTLTTTNIADVYDGTGALDIFTVSFQFWDTDEIEVFVRTKATGVDALQTEGADYTIAGGNGATGFLDTSVRATRIQTTEELHIRRVSDTRQNIDLTPSQKFPSATVEQAIDRQAMRQQEDRLALERLIRQPATDEDTDDGFPNLELPDKVTRASQFLGFDADGALTVATLVTTGVTTITAAAKTVLDDTTIAAMRVTLETIKALSDMSQIAADVIGSRPSAAAFGTGVFFATDEARFYYSDGVATWTGIGIAQFTNPNLPAFGNTGRIFLDTTNLILKRDTGSALVDVEGAWAYGTIGGLNVTTTTAAQVVVTPGGCRMGSAADRSLHNATLAAAMTKRLDLGSNWIAGTGNSGLPAAVALTADTWYEVFLIGNVLTGAVDVGVDTSAAAVNLLADAAGDSPGYIYYRHLGWVRSDGAGTGMLPLNGRGHIFAWTSDVVGFTGSGNYNALTDLDLSSGFPVSVEATFNWTVTLSTAGTYYQFTDTPYTLTQPSLTVSPGHLGDGGGGEAGGRVTHELSATATVGFRVSDGAAGAGDTAITLLINALSWVDHLRISP